MMNSCFRSLNEIVASVFLLGATMGTILPPALIAPNPSIIS
jgi:hypothetical protein